jgi:hypothetical protein
MRVKYEVYKITGIGFIDEFLSLIIFGLIMTVFMMIGFGVIAFVCVMLGKIFN